VVAWERFLVFRSNNKMINKTNKKKKRKHFWFEKNEDAKGYMPNDNRIDINIDRRENVRRTWNF